MKAHTKLLTAAIFAAFISTTYAGPLSWPPKYKTRVETKEHAESCCLPKEKVALACKDCNTVNEKGGEDKKGVLAWFKPDSKHDCSGCGGKIVVHAVAGGKATHYKYQHTCSKCGKDSAYTCATHEKS